MGYLLDVSEDGNFMLLANYGGVKRYSFTTGELDDISIETYAAKFTSDASIIIYTSQTELFIYNIDSQENFADQIKSILYDLGLFPKSDINGTEKSPLEEDQSIDDGLNNNESSTENNNQISERLDSELSSADVHQSITDKKNQVK